MNHAPANTPRIPSFILTFEANRQPLVSLPKRFLSLEEASSEGMRIIRAKNKRSLRYRVLLVDQDRTFKVSRY